MQAMNEQIARTLPTHVSEPREIRKLILKLRWIGMESEADRLGHLLAKVDPTDCAPMEPRETD